MLLRIEAIFFKYIYSYSIYIVNINNEISLVTVDTRIKTVVKCFQNS